MQPISTRARRALRSTKPAACSNKKVVTHSPESSRHILRHAVATVRYRAGKSLRDAPADFEHFKIAETVRTPLQILAHIGDLFDWALSMSQGSGQWVEAAPLPWHEEIERFHHSLNAFDHLLESEAHLAAPIDRLLQGPVADALTHVGQLATLRRLAGMPIKSENYFKAAITPGPHQP